MQEEKLFLLKRKISPYSGEDLFLGMYNDLELATRQRKRYLENCKTQDKWKEQAYKVVDLEKDVDIVELHDKYKEKIFPSEGQRVYLVSGLSEGFGQIIKSLLFISTKETKVKNFVQTKHNEEVEQDDEFAYYKYEELKLNI